MLDSIAGGLIGGVGKTVGSAVKGIKKLFGKKKKKKKAMPPPQDPRLDQILQNQTMQRCMMGQILQNQQQILGNQQQILGNQGAIMAQNAVTQNATLATLGNVAALNAVFSPVRTPSAFLVTMDRMFAVMPRPPVC